jgi:catechol 2,3-dioxygenase-like lactoylglutathione lyase family enzyme
VIDHFGINVRDIARSRVFYEATLAPMGYRVSKDFGEAIGFRTQGGFGPSPDPAGDFWLIKGPEVTAPIHFAFSAESEAVVDAFFKAALSAGGKSNGEPGLRPKYHANYYACFVLDPDGHNIEAVCHTAKVASS